MLFLIHKEQKYKDNCSARILTVRPGQVPESVPETVFQSTDNPQSVPHHLTIFKPSGNLRY